MRGAKKLFLSMNQDLICKLIEEKDGFKKERKKFLFNKIKVLIIL
jgi:hypothetical protein